MTFHENWFSDQSCQALADLFGMADGVTGDVVEVGCWEGRSTIALATACAPADLHAVDTWEGSDGEISRALAAQRDVFKQFQVNTAHLPNIRIYKCDWQTYFADHAGPTRFLHIDGCHSYDEVHGNIAAALPLMVPGAVICGDDAHHPPVQRAVIDHFGDASLSATLWWVQL